MDGELEGLVESIFCKRAAGGRATVAHLWQAAPALDDDDNR